MDILSQLNSPAMYLICGGIIFFVALVCVFFMVRAYRAGAAIGMDKTKMKRTITASATFAAAPERRHPGSASSRSRAVSVRRGHGCAFRSSARCTMKRRSRRPRRRQSVCRAFRPRQ